MFEFFFLHKLETSPKVIHVEIELDLIANLLQNLFILIRLWLRHFWLEHSVIHVQKRGMWKH